MAEKLINRRIFLQRAFAFSAASTLIGCGSGRSIVSGLSGANTELAPSTTPGAMHFFMIGDWGWVADGGAGQKQVAAAMQTYMHTYKFSLDAMLMLGDNFYDDMPGGVDSTRWQTSFEQVYPQNAFDCPFYAVAGNHDYQMSPQPKIDAELAYAARGGTRWTMPSPYYTFSLPVENPLVTFIALDTNRPNEPANPLPYNSSYYTPGDGDVATQLTWLAQELQTLPTTPYLVFLGHHPVYSDGVFGDNATLIRQVDPLLRLYGAHLHLAGHNHDLEHLEFAGHPTSFVVAGGGGAPLTSHNGTMMDRGPFYEQSYGFAHLEIRSSHITFRQLDGDGNVLHAFTKTPSGTVNILL